jgi:extracellular factor (EF) 3-hydroxypalmitic acid methyl ester biosynthesis protein
MAEGQFSRDFVQITTDFKKYLSGIKEKFDNFDKLVSSSTSQKDQISFVNKFKKVIFRNLDLFFKKVWLLIKDLQTAELNNYQKYFHKELFPILGSPEVNNRVITKPLGYDGDFILMNYIYDGEKKYFGESSFEKLINFYTCNIPICFSNRDRKKFLQKEIKDTLTKSANAKILSIACGPGRELVELLERGNNPSFIYNALDFEKRALSYLKEQVGDLKRYPVQVNYLHTNIVDLIKDKNLKQKLAGQNFIYATGLFDYLAEKIARKLMQNIIELATPGGKIIICNIFNKNDFYRAYFEFFGTWQMIYRNEDDLKKMVPIGSVREISFRKSKHYLFLKITK